MTPGPDYARRLETYLARVRALGAAEWGRLDSIGTRLGDNTPWARVRRARLDADAFFFLTQFLPREVVVGGAAAIRAVTDIGLWLGTRPARDPVAPPRRPVQHATDPRMPEPTAERRAAMAASERWVATVAELRRLVREGPGAAAARRATGGEAAIRVLEYGLSGIAVHEMDRDAARRLYAPVEPVIPFASLDGTQPRLAPPAG